MLLVTPLQFERKQNAEAYHLLAPIEQTVKASEAQELKL